MSLVFTVGLDTLSSVIVDYLNEVNYGVLRKHNKTRVLLCSVSITILKSFHQLDSMYSQASQQICDRLGHPAQHFF